MFTGIIENIGRVAARHVSETDIEMVIFTGHDFLKEVQLGDSIAVNGICLTVTRLMPENNPDHFHVDISHETLNKTTASRLDVGHRVNLEKALTLAKPLGGHLVSGHVDGVGTLQKKIADGHSTRYQFSAPKALLKFIAIKGSITVEGISLTVNELFDDGFSVSIIPHTETHTNLSDLSLNDSVNLEIDIVARYLQRLLTADNTSFNINGLTHE